MISWYKSLKKVGSLGSRYTLNLEGISGARRRGERKRACWCLTELEVPKEEQGQIARYHIVYSLQ